MNTTARTTFVFCRQLDEVQTRGSKGARITACVLGVLAVGFGIAALQCSALGVSTQAAIAALSSGGVVFVAGATLQRVKPVAVEPFREDPTAVLPDEVMVEIFKYLDFVALRASTEVSREWRRLVSDEHTWRAVMRRDCPRFGAEVWSRAGVEVEEPELPAEIYDIMRSPCPYWPEKSVCQTHRLVLIVEGMSLNRLGATFDPGFRFYPDTVRNRHGDAAPEESYWVLVTRDVVPGSRNKTLAEQQDLLAEGDELSHLHEAAAFALLEVQENTTTLLGNDPRTYTRCQDVVDGYPCALGSYVVGRGLSVCSIRWVNFHIGVVGCRKF